MTTMLRISVQSRPCRQSSTTSKVTSKEVQWTILLTRFYNVCAESFRRFLRGLRQLVIQRQAKLSSSQRHMHNRWLQ